MNEYTLAKQYLSWFLIITALLTGIMLLGLLSGCRDDVVWAQEIDLWHLTKAQKQTIAMVIAAEAAGEGVKGMQAVANTIYNRAMLGRISPYSVVIAPKQYYGLTAKNRAKLYASVRNTADWLSEHIAELPDITNGALYFRTAKEKHFKWCKIETARIGKHIFYK